MFKTWRANARLKGRVFDLAERVEALEADYTRLDMAYRKLRGTITGGIRTSKGDETEAVSDADINERILRGETVDA